MKSTALRLPTVVVSGVFAALLIPLAVNRELRSVEAKSKTADTDLDRSPVLIDPEATFEGARVAHDVYLNGRKGMRVHANFTVKYGIDVPCRLIAYFHFDDEGGKQLKAEDPSDLKYADSGGGVSPSMDFKPTADPAVYNDYQLFVPYDVLNMADGEYNLKFILKLYDLDGKRFFGQSGWYKFHHSWGSPNASTSRPAERRPQQESDPEATYEGARGVHDVYVDSQKGIRIHANFTVKYGIDVPCRLIAYFHFDDESERQLKAKDPADLKYSDLGGGVSAHVDFKPTADPAVYHDHQLFMPHAALNMANGEYNLKFRLKMYDLEGKRFFGQSGWNKFHLVRNSLPSAPVEANAGGEPETMPHWTSVPGPPGVTIKQVAVASSRTVYALDSGGTLFMWNGSEWDKKPGSVSQISVGSDGELWATNPPDSLRVLRFDGYNWTWNIPTGMKQVAVRDRNTIFGLGPDGALYRWNGSGWDKKGCCVGQISVGSDGELWATNPPDSLRVLRWDGYTWKTNIPTWMTLVTVGSAHNIWALDGSDQIFKWDGSRWKQIKGSLRSISVGGDGSVWGVDSRGVIYRHTN